MMLFQQPSECWYWCSLKLVSLRTPKNKNADLVGMEISLYHTLSFSKVYVK